MKSKRAREAATAAEDSIPVDNAPVEKKRKRSDDEPADEVTQKKVKKDKKDKKGKKDKSKYKKESRKEKKDKQKDLQDLPDQDAEEDEDPAQAAKMNGSKDSETKKEKKEKTEKKDKKEKKEKKAKKENESKVAGVNGDDKDEAKKEKKDKKKKKSKDETSTPTGEATATNNPDGDDAADKTEEGKPSRHIVFVGNLPFTATAESIKAHFASLKPISVRCMKNKDDDKPCRGIAFVEFGNVWTMRTCLDKFHHTEFEGRKINVELTAGGGGKTKFRKDKILEKNKKLDENRVKRIEKERLAKEENASGGGTAKREQSAGGIHPSRLARNPGLAH